MMGTFFKGRETILVGRPGFKPGGWRHASPGGFDSHSLPPFSFIPPCAAGAAPPLLWRNFGTSRGDAPCGPAEPAPWVPHAL